MSRTGARALDPADGAYPEALKQVESPPPSLFVAGTIRREDALAVAVVGARSATAYGRSMSEKLSGDLAARGVTIISGLARGIDTVAHRAALEAGGRTIAVLGCGLDVEYPRGSKDLKNTIVASGALVTEFGPATPPLPGHFPRRNRIISGLSLAVVVVEAARRSGSLITARWAADQGREVMAVPGRADSRLSEGPLRLIRDGATPITSADDVLEVLGLTLPAAPVTPDVGGVLSALTRRPMTAAELAGCCCLPMPCILAELTALEMDGRVRRGPGGIYAPTGRPVSKRS